MCKEFVFPKNKEKSSRGGTSQSKVTKCRGDGRGYVRGCAICLCHIDKHPPHTATPMKILIVDSDRDLCHGRVVRV